MHAHLYTVFWAFVACIPQSIEVDEGLDQKVGL